MGECMSKIKSSRRNQPTSPGYVNIEPKQANINTVTPDEFEIMVPSKRQIKYWNRRLNSILADSRLGAVTLASQISISDIGKFFNYTNFSQETMRKFYQFFKNQKTELTGEGFIEGLKKLVSISDPELSQLIYSLYFTRTISAQPQLQTFQQQFKNFIKGKDQSNSLNLRITQSNKQTQIANISQLKTILEQRRTVNQNDKSLKWLNKNIKFQNFKSYFLQNGIRLDQMEAYKAFLLDYNSLKSKISKQDSTLEKQVKIINWRWCQKMLKYFEQKYQIQGGNSNNILKRRPTTDSQSIFLQTQKLRKQSTDLRKSSIVETQPLLQDQNQAYGHRSSLGRRPSQFNRMVNQSSIYQNNNNSTNIQQLINITIKQKQVGSGLQFKNYPGQIDNYPLIGNFQWELKRNIRKDVDYVTIKSQASDKLDMAFGGGPKLQRRIIKGYIQLRPYFVVCARFTYQNVLGISRLTQSKTLRISSSDKLSSLQFDIPKNMIIYHKNIADDWLKYPDNFFNISNSQKIMDIFSETSFVIYMHPQYQKQFKLKYIDHSNSPRLGQMYSSQTYKIIDSIEQRTINSQKIQVCILNDQQRDFVEFVVLNWSHHIQRKVPLAQFKAKFNLVKNNLLITTMAKKNRAGISNLGNTCYMNAVIQALVSALKPDQITAIKGELGGQLKLLSKNIKQKKKSVSPFDFKTLFDKKAQYFQGQQQHDAHQFCLTLLDQLETDNKQLIQKLFQSKYKIQDKCSKCLKTQQLIEPCYIVSLPLRDFARKQVKIDYITDNVNIQTVVFSIDEDSTIEGWKSAFQKSSGAKQYYLCQIQNSIISRSFNKQNLKSDQQFYKQLQIQNHFLITAYQTTVFPTKLKFQKKNHDYRTYKNSKGSYNIVRIQQNPNKNANNTQKSNSQAQINGIASRNSVDNRKIKIKVAVGSQFQMKLVNQSQLLQFPQQFPYRQIYIKITNHDDLYNENIGKPFIFKLPAQSPLASVRQALQSCIGKSGDYILRISPLNQYSRCEICKKYNEYSSNCFIMKESVAPVCWIDGILQYVCVWKDAKYYHKLINRIKSSAIIPQNQTYSPQQYDSFQSSLQSLKQKQVIQVQQCNLCKYKNVNYQRIQQIIKWPSILIIHLKRFAIKNYTQICKIHTKWKLQQTIYVDKQKYVLQSVLCHIGTSADFGHYITISNGTCYDDQLVTDMPGGYNSIKPQEIYMIVYNKIQ